MRVVSRPAVLPSPRPSLNPPHLTRSCSVGATPLLRLAHVQMDEHVADTMRLLLAAGADGRSALEAALHWENLAALEVLIAAGQARPWQQRCVMQACATLAVQQGCS